MIECVHFFFILFSVSQHVVKKLKILGYEMCRWGGMILDLDLNSASTHLYGIYDLHMQVAIMDVDGKFQNSD